MNKQSNLFYQVFAFIIAVVLWMFVGMGSRFEMGERQMILPIALKNAPTSVALNAAPATASLKIEGPKKALDSLEENDFSVFVDLAHGWKQDLEINVTSPPGIKPATIEPHKVRVLLKTP
jgi:YbbR domain-containing protein